MTTLINQFISRKFTNDDMATNYYRLDNFLKTNLINKCFQLTLKGIEPTEIIITYDEEHQKNNDEFRDLLDKEIDAIRIGL